MRLPTRLLRRNLNSHKGDYGHVFILAGCSRYSGAAVLCAESALRSGAGLVTLGIPKGINNPIIKIKPKEVMTLPLAETKEGTLSITALKQILNFSDKANIVVLGPGLSQNQQTQRLARELVKKIDLPIVIDADGLNALVGHLDLLQRNSRREAAMIITPHPGEMARLLKVKVEAIQSARKKVAKDFAKDYNCITVLKGNRTVVANPEGKVYLNLTGNPGMASAGCGDVLTGMIAAFLAQELDGFSAAKYAVYLHGLAGDLAAKEKTQISLIASDITAKIPKAIKMSS